MKCPECSADTRLCQCAEAERDARDAAPSRLVSIIDHSVAALGYYGYRVPYVHFELRYTVVGGLSFPEDMLRYDDAREVARRPSPDNPRWTEVDIRAGRCTPERWRSFGWTVRGPVREYRYTKGTRPEEV